jgi:hypothetical protein
MEVEADQEAKEGWILVGRVVSVGWVGTDPVVVRQMAFSMGRRRRMMGSGIWPLPGRVLE